MGDVRRGLALSGGDWCCQKVISDVRRGLVLSGGDW